jgi:hypothetical protein
VGALALLTTLAVPSGNSCYHQVRTMKGFGGTVRLGIRLPKDSENGVADIFLDNLAAILAWVFCPPSDRAAIDRCTPELMLHLTARREP